MTNVFPMKNDSVELIIRRYRGPDLEEMIQLFRQTIRQVNIQDYTPEQVSAWAQENVDLPARWRQRLEKNVCFVAEIEGVLVGFAELTEGRCIHTMFVHQDFQGQGIGSALLKKLEAHFGKGDLWTEASIAAKPFFESKGFIITSVQNKFFNGVYFINFLMQKFAATSD